MEIEGHTNRGSKSDKCVEGVSGFENGQISEIRAPGERRECSRTSATHTEHLKTLAVM